MKGCGVIMAMSGGVDSSVSAAILKEKGYAVHGVHLRITAPEWPGCSSGEDERDAARVAAVLGIPFTVLDYSLQYKEKVIEEMLCEYKAGRTPNPDVSCNREIKFGLLYDWAMAQGAAYLATGHYARKYISTIQSSRDHIPSHAVTGDVVELIGNNLRVAFDKNKDQTYFLWTLTQEKLQHAFFPIGDYAKKDVRALARKFKLPTAEKKDSQGLCFVGQLDMKDFLKNHWHPQPGKVLDENGNIIGTHEGAMLYTLGERHGFSVNASSPKQKPLFVVAKDLKQNTITVSHDKLIFWTRRVQIESCNWIGEAPEEEKRCQARMRYQQPLQRCEVRRTEDGVMVAFDEAQIASPGQSLVLYDNDTCLGGGVITDNVL